MHLMIIYNILFTFNFHSIITTERIYKNSLTYYMYIKSVMHLFLNIPKKYFLGIDRISGLPETSAGYFGIRLDICQDPLLGRKFYQISGIRPSIK